MSAPSSRLPRVLGVSGAVALAWAVLAWLTGGVAFSVAGVRVSARGPTRPALIGLVLLALALWRLTPQARRVAVARTAARTDRVAPWVAALIAVGLAALSAVYGAHVAGGADSSGYLNESRLLQQGRVTMPVAAIDGQEWPWRGWLTSPLGFSPSPIPERLAPTYAPGLPLLMAAGAAVLGEAGRFLWTPLLVGLLVALTYRWAAAVTPPTIALAATVLVASSPPLLFAAVQTMSDVPVSALWLAALLLAGGARLWRQVAAGLVLALAVLVRPNLVLVAGAVWLASLLAGGDGADRIKRAIVVGAPAGMAAIGIAMMNRRLWGSALSSGYGSAAILYAWAPVPENLAAIWRWTGETGGYWMPFGVVAAIVAGLRDRRWRGGALLAATVFASYLPYFVFKEWWYLRFYLPAWPVAATGAAAGAWWLLRGRLGELSPIVVLALALAVAATGERRAHAVDIFGFWRDDQRYAAIGTFVREHTSPRAVIVAVQHSGALAYYGGRSIGRFDHVNGDALDVTCERWRRDGREVWAVLEAWEEVEFRQRFAGQVRGRLDWAPIGESRVGPTRVRIYDLADPTRQTAPALVPPGPSRPWPWLRPWTPAQ